MKHLILAFLATAVAIGLLAQGEQGSHGWRRFENPYDPKTAPPLGLSEAYNLTLAHIGTATNRFYCVTASCLEKTKRGLPGWTFCFCSTNGDRAYVEVSFDKEVVVDSGPDELLHPK